MCAHALLLHNCCVLLCVCFAGIGRPEGQMDIASWVLQEFRRSEMDAISQAIDESRSIIDSCLALGLEKAVSGSRL